MISYRHAYDPPSVVWIYLPKLVFPLFGSGVNDKIWKVLFGVYIWLSGCMREHLGDQLVEIANGVIIIIPRIQFLHNLV